MTGADGSDIAGLKARLRAEARAARLKVPKRAAAGQALARHFEASPWAPVTAGTVVAGYWPVRGEIDCRPLLNRLRRAGASIALPEVEIPDAPLTFRRWNGEPPEFRDLMNMAGPGPEAERAFPELLFVPLLLADRAGHRLGYGGGYYDRTLNTLRKAGKVTALGLAFEVQLTDKLPSAVNDMTLDGLITEMGCRKFR